LVVVAVLSQVADGSLAECRGLPADSCAASPAEDVKLPEDETSLMQLTDKVKKGGLKRSAEAAASESGKASSKQAATDASEARSDLSLPFPVFGSSLLQLEASEAVSKPSKGSGASLLQLGASSVSKSHKDDSHKDDAADYQKEYLSLLHMQYLHKDDAKLESSSASELSEGFTDAESSHLLAYVVLFGIVIVLLGLGLIVILGMKKEEEEEETYKPLMEDTMMVGARQPMEAMPPPTAEHFSSNQGSILSSGPTAAAHQPPRPASPPVQTQKSPAAYGSGMGSPAYGTPLNTMQGNPITHTTHQLNDQLCPELKGAAVPENSKFPMKIPILLHKIKDDQEHAILRTVQCRDGTPMFNLKITRRKPLPHETNHPEEYIRLSLPEEDSKELVLCAFGRPMKDKLECHIYQNGKDPWGIVREDPQSGSYTVYMKNSLPALQAVVTGYGGDRRVKLLKYGQDTDIANATALGSGSDSFYEVECYPGCDIILAIILITGVDRMAANNGK
jgi:hypothetical protein